MNHEPFFTRTLQWTDIRATQGVRLIQLDDDDKVTAATLTESEGENGNGNGNGNGSEAEVPPTIN